MANYAFKSAIVENEAGRRFRLDRAETGMSGSGRTPWRLRLIAKGNPALVIEMSRKEAYAFSEWLDEAVTEDPAA